MQAPKGLPNLDATHSIDGHFDARDDADAADDHALPKGFPSNGNGAGGSSEVEHVAAILPWLRAFGYTRESLELLMAPMASTGAAPVHRNCSDSGAAAAVWPTGSC